MGQFDDLFFIFTVLLVVVSGFFLMVSFTNWSMESTKEEQTNNIIPLCSYECQKYDMKFLELVNDGWMYDCWCFSNQPAYIKRYNGNDFN